MELERGYIDREPMPFGRRISRDGLFEALAEPLVGALSGGDGGLFSLQATIAGNVADGLDALFVSTVGAAEDVAENNSGAGDDQTAHALVDNGHGVDAQRTASLPYLPQSDAPIEGNFRELPAFGQGHAGDGGIEGGDDNSEKD
jgi:hypothetical protein